MGRRVDRRDRDLLLQEREGGVTPNGYETFGELGRAFDTFRREDYTEFRKDVLDELKFLRRLLFTTLGTAILAGLLTSVFAAIRGT